MSFKPLLEMTEKEHLDAIEWHQARRKVNTRRRPKKITVGNLAKAWGYPKEILAAAIIKHFGGKNVPDS